MPNLVNFLHPVLSLSVVVYGVLYFAVSSIVYFLADRTATQYDRLLA